MALIEVLISVALLGVGGIAIARLLTLGLSEGGAAKERALAAQLAREKLDDLRQFSQLDTGPAGIFGYDEILAGRGGTENADGSLRLAVAGISQSDTDYQRDWSVTAFYYCADNGMASITACSPPTLRPDFKHVAVTLSWIDSKGAGQQLTLDSSVAAIEPALAVNALIPAAAAVQPVVTPVDAP